MKASFILLSFLVKKCPSLHQDNNKIATKNNAKNKKDQKGKKGGSQQKGRSDYNCRPVVIVLCL